MSNNITVEMVQEELISISELYNKDSHPTLAHDIHSNIRPTDVIEDLRDVVHYALVCFEENFGINPEEANFWIQRGYAPSVARMIAYDVVRANDSGELLPALKERLIPQEYRGALRVGDTVSYKHMEDVNDLWTVDRYRLLDGTETQLPIQILFLERRKNNGNNERKVVNYFLSPDATNEVVPF